VPGTPGTSGAPGTLSTREDLDVSWEQFSQFCLVSSLWALQQAALGVELRRALDSLSRSELLALQRSFSRYDAELSGCIPTSDLYCLLQDMGEEYDEMEIGLTSTVLDPDNCGVILFPDFARWWCE
jgi:hypothetical protein